jgi:hypothetical protein
VCSGDRRFLIVGESPANQKLVLFPDGLLAKDNRRSFDSSAAADLLARRVWCRGRGGVGSIPGAQMPGTWGTQLQVPVVSPANRKLLFPDGLLRKDNRRSFAYHPQTEKRLGPRALRMTGNFVCCELALGSLASARDK